MKRLDLYEFDEARQLPAGIDPDGLKQYLRQVWHNRHSLYHYSEEILPQAGSQPFLQFDGSWIQAQNYAGIIHYQGVTLYLFPKLFKSSPSVDFQAARQTPASATTMLAHLSFYLSYCQQARFPFQTHPTEPIPSDLLHYWIRCFASFTLQTLTRQPYQTYQTHTSETDYLRGKLAVQAYLNEQLTRGQWQRVQTEQQPFLLDNRFNQIVRYTVSRLHTIADSPTQAVLQDIEWLLHDVDLRACSATDCDAVYLNRLYPNHQSILDMCRFFLAGEAGSEVSMHTMNFTFLVPMERIFEDFVAGFIRKHFPDWQAECQKSILLGLRGDNQWIHARPDIWLPLHQTVWDTKYKPGMTQPSATRIASADLYQMFAYATACQITEAHLLYAATQPNASETIRMGGEASSIRVSIHSLPIVLTDAADTFSALTLRLTETLRKIAAP